MDADLNHLRGELDDLDVRFVEMLAQREQIVGRIGALKVTGGKLRDIQREEEILARLAAQAKSAGLDPFLVTRIFREVLEHSMRRQHEALAAQHDPLRGAASVTVVYQGTEGAYSYLAAQRHFGPRGAEVRLQGCQSFVEMLEAVQAGDAQYAVLPIENTTAGSINEAYDLLAKMNLSLIGEEIQKVEHCLLALDEVPLTRIRRIYSHPKALDQCTEFLRTLVDCHVESYTDTAMSAQKVRDDNDLSQAAIASEEAGRIFGLKVIRRGIANQAENFTRFVIVAREPMKFDARIPCKTSVVFATRHEEGALLNCLNALAEHHLNMTKLESRPRPHTPFEYLFYVDFEGNLSEPKVEAGLRALASKTSYMKVLGCYPSKTAKEARVADLKPLAAPTAASPSAEPAASPAPAKTAVPAAPPGKKAYTLASRAARSEDTVIRVGNVLIGGERPVIIAGPCSVESREQIMVCARAVKESGGDILRGGCFKPRTSPYAFQGLGLDGLEMMWEAGQTFGLPIVTEVMHPGDLEPVARRADIIQLGARNMQNFSLLKECGRIDRPIMLKRGMMSSIDEWLQAAEYILAHGNQQVILCERGIRTFETATRNTLDLGAVPVTRELTHLPVIVDPSHACGVRRWVSAMSLASLAAGAQGIMIEMHPDPEKALSDGPQALTFDMFADLMRATRR